MEVGRVDGKLLPRQVRFFCLKYGIKKLSQFLSLLSIIILQVLILLFMFYKQSWSDAAK